LKHLVLEEAQEDTKELRRYILKSELVRSCWLRTGFNGDIRFSYVRPPSRPTAAVSANFRARLQSRQCAEDLHIGWLYDHWPEEQ
jgi:hypothetical protein